LKSSPNSAIRALIIDMDGVLWRDTQPIGDLYGIFDTFAKLGWQVTLATNNATKTVDQYIQKLAGFGVHLNSHQIVNSSMAVAHYLQHRYPSGGNVFVVGEDSLIEVLAQAGFIHNPDDALAVIGSMDRQVTYNKLKQATLLIRSGLPFIGTNPDRTFPTPQGLVPGSGAILAALEAATDQTPLILGKPSPEMYQVAMERMSVRPENTLVIGDRLETDIVGAQRLGCLTALVLSGVTTPQAADAWRPPPDWIASDLATLIKNLQWMPNL